MSKPSSPTNLSITCNYCSIIVSFTASAGATTYKVVAKNTCNYSCIYEFSIYSPSGTGNVSVPIVINYPGIYVFSVTATNSFGTSDPTTSIPYYINNCCPCPCP